MSRDDHTRAVLTDWYDGFLGRWCDQLPHVDIERDDETDIVVWTGDGPDTPEMHAVLRDVMAMAEGRFRLQHYDQHPEPVERCHERWTHDLGASWYRCTHLAGHVGGHYGEREA